MSPSSSSTSNTSTTSRLTGSTIGVLVHACRRTHLGVLFPLGDMFSLRVPPGYLLVDHWQSETEPAARGHARVQPDPPAVVFDDLAAHREADAGARVVGLVVQALEDHEDAFGIV